jgi:hypothetical protein
VRLIVHLVLFLDRCRENLSIRLLDLSNFVSMRDMLAFAACKGGPPWPPLA